jgi:hypothetical protein
MSWQLVPERTEVTRGETLPVSLILTLGANATARVLYQRLPSGYRPGSGMSSSPTFPQMLRRVVIAC